MEVQFPWLVGWTREENRELCAVIGIGKEDGKRLLDRVVGGISEKFWKENHIENNSAVVESNDNVEVGGGIIDEEGLEAGDVDLDM